MNQLMPIQQDIIPSASFREHNNIFDLSFFEPLEVYKLYSIP